MSGGNDCRSARPDGGREIGKKVMIEPGPITEPPPRAVAKARPVDQHAAAALGSKTFGQRTHFFAARNGAEGREEQHGPASPQCLLGDFDRPSLPFPWKGAGCCHGGSFATGRAETHELHRVTIEGKAETASETFCRSRDPRIFGLDNRAATPADEHLAGMRVIRHRTGDEALGAFDTMHQAKLGQEIETAVDAGGGCRGILRTQKVENFISCEWMFRGDHQHQNISAQPGQAGAHTPAKFLGRLLGSCMIVWSGHWHTLSHPPAHLRH
jgi:hypothetical protein